MRVTSSMTMTLALAAAMLSLTLISPLTAADLSLDLTDLSHAYSVTTTNDDPIVLASGVAHSNFIQLNDYQYYKFTAGSNVVNMSVVATALTGDVDVYLSNHTQTPTADTHDFESSGWGSDAIDLVNATAGDYYIGVKGYTNASYTLMAIIFTDSDGEDDNIITIADGQPQSGVQLWRRREKYYRFSIPEGTHSFSVSLSARIGDADCFLKKGTAKPTRTSYDWASQAVGSDIITVDSPQVGAYTLGVYAYASTDYTVVYTRDTSTLHLVAGAAFRAEQNVVDNYRYYDMSVSSVQENKEMTVTVTCTNGDADIFASSATDQPTQFDNMKSATSYGTDAITIASDQLHAGDKWTFGVLSRTETSYTIIARYNDPITLQTGQPHQDTVAKEAMQYYRLTVKAYTGDLTITAQPTEGNVKLYVTNITDIEPESDKPSTYNYTSVNPSALQTILITEDELHQGRMKWGDRNFLVGVEGLTASTYSITASTRYGSTRLQEGKATTGIVPDNKFKYFSFDITAPNTTIIVSVTPMDDSDSDLYIAKPCTPTMREDECNTRPNKTHSTWQSMRIGQDVIVIDHNDENNKVGTLYIGVTAYHGNSTFSITASILRQNDSQSSRITLVDGQSHTGYAETQMSQIYSYTVPEHASDDLTISATPLSGDIDLYVTSNGSIPSKNCHQWESLRWGADSIQIDSAPPGVYLIAATAYTRSLYTITAARSEALTQLLNGVKLNGQVSDQKYRYYHIHVGPNVPQLVVTCIALTGDSDIFLSHTVQKPNQTTHDQSSINIGSDIIQIDTPQEGEYYISVYGFRNSSYQLTATVGAIQLSPGEVHSDKIRPNKNRLYSFAYDRQQADRSKGNTDLMIVLDADSNSASFEVYVCNDRDNDDCVHPDADHFTWHKSYDASTEDDQSSGSSLVIAIPESDAKQCHDQCTYKVSVFAHDSYASYNILAGYGTQPLLLPEGHGMTTELAAEEWRYFRQPISQHTQNDVYIDATELLGDVQLVVSTKHPRPTLNNSEWVSPDNPNSNGNHLTIAANDTKLDLASGDKVLHIGILGMAEQSRVRVSSTTQNQLLVSGVPARSRSRYQGSFFAMFADDTEKSDITFRVDRVNCMQSRDTQFTLYITANATDTTEPTKDHHQWTKVVKFGEDFTIFKNDDKIPAASTTYFVGVFTEEYSVDFQMLGSTDKSVEVVMDRQSVAGVLQTEGQYKFYEISIQKAANLTVILDQCRGTSNLYLDNKVRKPQRGSADYVDDDKDQNKRITITKAIKSASYYFSVEATEDDVEYEVRTIAGEIDIPDRSPWLRPQRRQINATVNNDGKVELSFVRAWPRRNTTSHDYEYAVFYLDQDANTNNAKPYSRCGLTKYATLHKAYRFDDEMGDADIQRWYTAAAHIESHAADSLHDDPTPSPSTRPPRPPRPAPKRQVITLDGLDVSRKYSFNIIVTNKARDAQVPGTINTVVYTSATLAPSSSWATALLHQMLWFGIPVVGLLVGLIVVLCRRNRKLAMDLAVEMNDVNQSSVRASMRQPLAGTGMYSGDESPARKPGKYDRLVDNQDDELDDSEV